MNNINYIESKGFIIRGVYIYHPSNKRKHIGKLNQENFYFFTTNENKCYPFKSGVNFFDNSTLVDHNYIAYVKSNEEATRTDFGLSYEQYVEVTNENSVFQKHLSKITKDWLGTAPKNYYDLRGVNGGYLNNSVCFPFIDYNNNFVTAQIIKYDSNGKRGKGKYDTNWLHSYKPILKDLGSEEKFSVKNRCFFGENYLNGSDNVVAIVEAPKTAVTLKELYPNIDWIATAGELHIKSKNLNVLKDKKVVLFPDAHSKLWFEFAELNNFYASTILETELAEEGSDLADYVTNEESPLYNEIMELLIDLSDGKINWQGKYNQKQLDFKQVKENNNYAPLLSPFYKTKVLKLSIDNSKDFKIQHKGTFFDIYEKELFEDDKFKGFEVYSAQLDLHRQIKVKGKGFRFMNEKEFINALEGSFRVLKTLNPEIYKDAFKHYLNRLKKSNFSVNIDFIKDILVEQWDVTNSDLSKYRKVRDWKFKGGEQLDRIEFIKELFNDKFKARLIIKLNGLYDALSENRFIDFETDLGVEGDNMVCKGYSRLKTWVDDWNEKVIGAKTVKTFENQQLIESVVKNTPYHIKNNIYSGVKNTTPKLSVRKIMKLTGIKNDRAISQYLNFKSDNKLAETIKDEVFYLIENINDIIPIKKDNRIVDFEVDIRISKSESMLKHNNSMENVFSTLEELKSVDDSNLNKKQKDVLETEKQYLKLYEKCSTFNEDEIEEKLEYSFNRLQLINEYF